MDVKRQKPVGAPAQGAEANSAKTFDVTDFNDLISVYANWQGQIEQLSEGRFAGKIQLLVGNSVRLATCEGDRSIRVRGRDASGLVGIYPLVPGVASAVWSGRRHELGQVFVGGAQDETDIYSGRDFSGRVIFLEPQALAQAARLLLEWDDVDFARSGILDASSPTAFADANRRLDRLLRKALADPSFLGSAEGRRLEQECIRALVESLAPAVRAARPSSHRRAQLLRQASDYLRAHLDKAVSAVDLCRELRVSDRTLRLAFRETFGVGPMTYFRYLRLNAVHAKLRSDPAIAVADAARAVGFHHLGNFAADYRRLFGARPSETERPA